MNRDMELVRIILMEIQAGCVNEKIEGYDEDTVKYHKKLLIEAGLVKGRFIKDYSGTSKIPESVVLDEISWQGHDLIDVIKDENSWMRVKSFLSESGKSITIEAVRQAVKVVFQAL